jgi:hypothetical protein
MKKIGLNFLVCLYPLSSLANPFATISCDTPKGSSMEYGVSSYARIQSIIDKKTIPEPSLVVIKDDGYEEKPTFTISSEKKKLIVTWSESEGDLIKRKKAKEKGVPYCCSVNQSSEAEVVIFTPDHITAIEIGSPNFITSYSFFPKLGTMFINNQGIDAFGKNSHQHSFFATCKYYWSKLK